jgi:hypothetical protein
MREVHLSLSVDLWKSLVDYCRSLGEHNISLAMRTLMRERLSQLGFVKGKFEIFPSPKSTLQETPVDTRNASIE